MALEDLRVSVWEKRAAGEGWGKVAELATWTEADFEPRHNQPGPWSLKVPFGAQVADLSARNLLTFDYRGQRFTGTIEDFSTETDERGVPHLVPFGLDVLNWLSDPLLWPSPSLAIHAQAEALYYATGSAETVLRNAIVSNLVTRLGYEVVVPASQGRGSTVTIMAEFPNLWEVVREKANYAGLGVRMGLVNRAGTSTRADLTVEFYVPADRSNRVRLSHRVGTLKSWKHTKKLPVATRAVVRASREETGRTVASVNTSTDTIATTEAHGLKTGDLVTFTGDSLPAPLLPGVTYAAILVGGLFGGYAFKVAQTRAAAMRGTAINLTSEGSGSITVTESARIYGMHSDSSAEAAWGRKREVLVDGGLDDGSTALLEAAEQALLDAAGQEGFELETAEVAGMRYGDHYGLGDSVLVELATGVTSTQPLGGVHVHADVSSGLTFNAIPGNPDATKPMFGQASIIRALRKQIAAQQRKD